MVREKPAIPWLEIHSENFFAAGGPQIALLETLRRDYPLSLHGVGLSLGSADGIDADHLQQLESLIQRVEPAAVSEHLCWAAFGARHSNDLLPMPYTEEALALLTSRVSQVQDRLGRQILIENVSSYLRYRGETLEEWDFLVALSRASGCAILLDINNIYVNACNHGFDCARYLAALSGPSIGEIHLAGHSIEIVEDVELRIDTHSTCVCAEVWGLYDQAIARFGAKPTLIEWDNDIPALDVLRAEADRAETVLRHARTD